MGLPLLTILPSYRLRATGVVNVENPVRTAVEQGRIEELD